MSPKKPKGRYFAFILYPESIPDDWTVKLESLDIPMAISPLHDKDLKEVSESEMTPKELEIVNNGGKLYKKSHYHVLYVAKNPVTVDGVRNKIKRALSDNAVSHVEIVDGVKSYFDYLTHESKDAIAKNKHKYSKADIKYIQDFDIDRYITMDDNEKKELMNLIFNLIRSYGIQNIFDLGDFVDQRGADYGLPSMDKINDVLKGNTGLLKLYFDGAYQRAKKGNSRKDWN
ncbi:MAG: replication protein [Enterococcus sp.]|nr:replication protein [Enterococcus sp.]